MFPFPTPPLLRNRSLYEHDAACPCPFNIAARIRVKYKLHIKNRYKSLLATVCVLLCVGIVMRGGGADLPSPSHPTVGFIETLDQSHLYPNLEVPGLTCPGQESNLGLPCGKQVL
jgi:hypothetical protein